MFNAYLTTTLQYNAELCIGCGVCAEVCPHAVFVMNGRLAELVRPEACMECGACQLNCVVGAITVEAGVGCATLMIYEGLTGKKQSCGGEQPVSSSSCGGEIVNNSSSGCSGKN